MSYATLYRIPVAQWNTLVFLRTSNNHGNAATMSTYLGIDATGLAELQDQGLITANGPRGREVKLQEATWLRGVTIRLTDKGKTAGAAVVRAAVLLRWLQRIGRRGATLRQVATNHAGFDLPQVRELEELRFVEAFLPDSDGRTVPMQDVTVMGDMVRLRITAIGRRYTAD